ncbi:MAG TPA: ExeM/NucH family extracellular endonuclease, partial [Bryobacteraceae bacterium]|nr:ExeM/NucH family extracellular endonuclease [Bryobacteraceae bacterium]
EAAGDTLAEPDETFTLSLTNLVGAGPVLPTLQATGTILNDDALTTTLSFSPPALPGATEGVSYSESLTVVNGAACSFDTTGALPPGLALQFSGSDAVAVLTGTPALTGTYTFTVSAGCSNGTTLQSYSISVAFACETGVKTSTAIHAIQGSGPVSLLAGQTREAEGIVVGVFNGDGQFGGYYLQEPEATWDSDPATSEGIFVHDNGTLAVNPGDRVRVRGVVTEYVSTAPSSLTELDSVAGELTCSAGHTFTRTTVTLPTAAAGDLERYEGMAVTLPQQLVVTGNYNLGTFGQIDLAPQVLFQPTQSPVQSSWPTQTDLNARSIISLDDGQSLANANLYPTLYPQGGLSAANTLRVGALVNYDPVAHTNTPLTGVMDDRYGTMRIQPAGEVRFYQANPRPDAVPLVASVGGRFRAVSANVLNFFTTLGSRGAQTQTEFDHQKTKVIEALYAMNADLYGLSEVQNFANGNTSGGTYTNAALESLVTGLNCKASGLDPLCANPTAAVFAFIDTLGLGASNGTDAIRSAILYKPASLAPVGSPASYYQNDTNRPTLAQTFRPATGMKAAQQTFTFVVNHFRSKGSACGGSSDDVYQGTCNGLRLNMATNVVNWLAGNPTADPAGANRRLLLVGDFNAYYGEDPIQYLASNGYTDLIHQILGDSAYSYNFGSQAGYLDHALVNARASVMVRRVAEWHNNADEPSSLQALNSSNKSAAAQAAYYAPDPWAASDHDPIVIGFNTLGGDLNDDGAVDAADQRLLTTAVGQNASAVDRRMDYDGDGKITLNDYRLWATYYQAYRQ